MRCYSGVKTMTLKRRCETQEETVNKDIVEYVSKSEQMLTM